MASRPAQPDDVPAITALHAAYDTHWFGAPEQDEDEVRQSLGRVDPLAGRSRVVLDDDGRITGAAWWWGEQTPSTTLVVDPSAGAAPYDELLEWLRDNGVEVAEALAVDTVAVESLERQGWVHERSSFEL